MADCDLYNETDAGRIGTHKVSRILSGSNSKTTLNSIEYRDEIELHPGFTARIESENNIRMGSIDWNENGKLLLMAGSKNKVRLTALDIFNNERIFHKNNDVTFKHVDIKHNLRSLLKESSTNQSISLRRQKYTASPLEVSTNCHIQGATSHTSSVESEETRTYSTQTVDHVLASPSSGFISLSTPVLNSGTSDIGITLEGDTSLYELVGHVKKHRVSNN